MIMRRWMRRAVGGAAATRHALIAFVPVLALGGVLVGCNDGTSTVPAATSTAPPVTVPPVTPPVTPPASSAVNVTTKVLDQTSVGVNGAAVSFSTVGAAVTTDPHGAFTTTAVPGSNTVTVSRDGATLLAQVVTVAADGSIAEFPNGIPVTLVFGGPDQIKARLVARPPLSVTPTMPYSGQTVTVAFADASATAINVTYTGAGCGALMSATLTGSSYTQTAAVGSAGNCDISAVVTYAAGPTTFVSQFRVQATSVTLPAFSVVGGDFIPGDALPAAKSLSGALAVTGATGPGSLINGAVARVFVTTTDAATAANLVTFRVALHGGAGYYTVPAQAANGQAFFDLALDQDYFTTAASSLPSAARNAMSVASRVLSGATSAPMSAAVAPSSAALKAFGLTRRARYRPLDDPGTGTGTVSFDVQAEDNQGNVSQPETTSFSVTQVGTGTLQISLSWGTPDDLDLHVVEPSGDEIFYGNTIAADGGKLDLDSNAGCQIDNVDTENVTWPGVAPAPGTYIVRSDYFASCSGAAPAYQVTVNNCGNVTHFTGSYPADGDDGGDAGSGVTVTTFDFKGCNGYEVAGNASYEDLEQTPSGLSTSPVLMPIRFATVEVHRASDDTVLATGSTDAAGKYDVTFNNTGTPGYYVKVVAANTSPVNQEVKDKNGADWSFKSPVYDETLFPVEIAANLQALVTDVGPAFNVFDLGVDGTQSVRDNFHASPTKLTWIYYDQQAPAPCPNVSCFVNAQDTIYVNGGKSVVGETSDPDVYDDVVLLHEYGHFVQKYFSADHSPGGQHFFEMRYDPRLAWSEGSATFFALATRHTPEYLDTTATGTGTDYFVTLPLSATLGAPLGTDDGTQVGYLGEVMVTAGMYAWGVTNNNLAVAFGAMAAMKPLTPESQSGRDFIGADYVDFLDGWKCSGGTYSELMQAQVSDQLTFPYDYAPDTIPGFCGNVFPDAIPPGVHPAAAPATGSAHAQAYRMRAPLPKSGGGKRAAQQ